MAEVVSSSGVKLVAVIRRFFFEPDNQSNNPITPSITGKNVRLSVMSTGLKAQ
jgi:hypothetical protein